MLCSRKAFGSILDMLMSAITKYTVCNDLGAE
jgi:hypothetical protein